jgi:hypothetical protein
VPQALASFCCDMPGKFNPKNARAAPAAIDPAFFTASLRDKILFTTSVKSFFSSIFFSLLKNVS